MFSRLACVVFLTTLCSAEISVFDAGNLNAKDPYGLTQNEKELLSNKRNLANLQSTMSMTEEQIQGIQSLLDGISSRLAKIEKRLNELEGKTNDENNSTRVQLDELRIYSEKTRQIQDKNYKNITNTLNKLAKMIDAKASVSLAATQESAPKADKNKFANKSSKDIFNEGVKLFNANKFDSAKEYFDHLVAKNYRVAASSFYLGEINYAKKQYASAVKLYQQSVQKDDKASYMPKLLYHTAISFDKVGDTASANRFYKALKIGYPDSKEAKAAPNRK